MGWWCDILPYIQNYMKKFKASWIIIAVVALIVVLLALPSFSEKNIEISNRLDELGIECLPNGHANLGQHIHPVLEVMVDGVRQTIPGNLGITATCMPELHTHDASGVIHIETVSARKTFELGTFLRLWGFPYEREGYNAILTVDGVPSQDGEKLILKDDQAIVLVYVKQ